MRMKVRVAKENHSCEGEVRIDIKIKSQLQNKKPEVQLRLQKIKTELRDKTQTLEKSEN